MQPLLVHYYTLMQQSDHSAARHCLQLNDRIAPSLVATSWPTSMMTSLYHPVKLSNDELSLYNALSIIAVDSASWENSTRAVFTHATLC